MPTDDAFDIAWDSVYDIEKGWIDDFKTGRKLRQSKNAVYHSEESRANRTAYSMKLRQLLIDTGGRPTREQLAGIQPDVATQVAEPEPAVEEIAPEGMSLDEANRVFDDDDDSDDGGPPITERRRPPDPPGNAVKPDITEIVEEQTSEPPGPITDLASLLPSPPERKTEEPVVSEPPKPPGGAVIPKPSDVVMQPPEKEALNEGKLADTTKPLKAPTNESELEAFTEEQQDFRFPETRPEGLTGRKYKGGMREFQTKLTDDPKIALEGIESAIPLLTSQGNPMKLDNKTGWYVRSGADGLEYFHEADPSNVVSESEAQILSMKRPTVAGGAYTSPDWKKVPYGKKHTIGMRHTRVPSNVYYPMPGTQAIDQKTGEVIRGEQAVDDAWTVVKNPHANPFTDFRSVLAINKKKPPERSIPVSDPIIMKEETPLQRLGKAGFSMVEGDNLSLLPTNLLLDADKETQDDTSLLPAGWRND